MATWKPRPVSRPYAILELTADPRYQVRPEWARGEDGVMRLRYRAFFDGKPAEAMCWVSQQEATDNAKRLAR